MMILKGNFFKQIGQFFISILDFVKNYWLAILIICVILFIVYLLVNILYFPKIIKNISGIINSQAAAENEEFLKAMSSDTATNKDTERV